LTRTIRFRAGRAHTVVVLVGILLLTSAVTACDPVTPEGGGGAGAAGSSADLGACPELSRGQAGQAACVRELQQALRDHGYPDQPVTGVFGAVTEQNVRDYQRRAGIQPASGVFGPKTRAALTGGVSARGSGGAAVPAVALTDYSTRSRCDDSRCSFYLRRGPTRRYAKLIREHPRIAALVAGTILAGVCRLLRVKIATAVCALLAGSYADDIGDDLEAAARQGACLRTSVGPSSGPRGTWKLLDSDPDNGPSCRD
jgi:hypothetical protein